jgi:hypothetical protein
LQIGKYYDNIDNKWGNNFFYTRAEGGTQMGKVRTVGERVRSSNGEELRTLFLIPSAM